MSTVIAKINLKGKPKALIQLKDLDFNKNVTYLKEEICQKLKLEPNTIEIIYNGNALEDNDIKLSDILRENATVYCFAKMKQYIPKSPNAHKFIPIEEVNTPANIEKVVNLFATVAHCQISLNSRYNILNKIVADIPELGTNLGAQALLRDSILFNHLHQTNAVANMAKHYPIICSAAPHIVSIIKKEIIKSVTTTSPTETANDSTNSSEEENTVSPSGSGNTVAAGAAANSTAQQQQSEHARIRMISRQQLASALALISDSQNSLSNIAQRANAPPIVNSGERITSQLLQRALSTAAQQPQSPITPPPTPERHTTSARRTTAPRLSSGFVPLRITDATETPSNNDTTTTTTNAPVGDVGEPDNDPLPRYYRNHKYASELRTLAQMGFLNYAENLIFLEITNGNIESTVNLLTSSMN